jgi:hypothetical protein
MLGGASGVRVLRGRGCEMNVSDEADSCYLGGSLLNECWQIIEWRMP